MQRLQWHEGAVQTWLAFIAHPEAPADECLQGVALLLETAPLEFARQGTFQFAQRFPEHPKLAALMSALAERQAAAARAAQAKALWAPWV
jgi:hypothetical protein